MTDRQSSKIRHQKNFVSLLHNHTVHLMNTVQRFATLCALAFGTVLPAQAQRTLSLGDAVAIAIENNTTVRTGKLDIAKADAAVKEAFGSALPNVNVSASYTRNVELPKIFFPNPATGEFTAFEIGQDNAYSLTASVNQVLFNSAVFTGVGTANTYAKISRSALKSTIGKTAQSAKEAYYRAALAKENVDLLMKSYENLRDNVKNVETLFGQGLVAEYDLLRAQVQLANLEPQITQARNSYQDALNALKITLGLATGDDIQVTSVDTTTSSVWRAVSLADIRRSIAERNFDLQALELQRSVNTEIVDLYGSEYLPTLSLFGNYSFQGQSNTFTFQNISQGAVGLQLEVNLFNGFKTSAKVEQARIEAEKTSVSKQQAEESLYLQAQSALQRLQRAAEQITSQRKTVDQAQRGYDIAMVRYGQGLGAQIEISDAELALRTARLNLLQTTFDYLISAAELDQLTGDLSFVNLSKYGLDN